MFHASLSQQRHKLKAKYFDGIAASMILASSPHKTLTDDQWGDLVKHWSDPKNVVCS
jgi:hypothetical protein